MRLRLDEMVPVGVARELCNRGFEVDAVAEHPSLRGLSDAEQFTEADGDHRTLVTYDAGDFLALSAQRRAGGEAHAGIVLLRWDRFPQGRPDLIIASLGALMAGPAPSAAFVHWLE